jgi:hypothetical protein
VSVVWTLIFCVIAAAAAVGLLLYVRRRAPDGGFFNDGDRAAGTFGMLSTGFAILLGFIVFLAFESFDQSRTGAEAEAIAVAQQFETAQFFPERFQAPLGGQLVCYARYVVQQEWPAMEDGGRPPEVNPWAVRLFRTLRAVEPTLASQETAYGKWFDQTTDRESARSDRIHGAEGVIPPPLWAILFLGAVVIAGYMLFFADRGGRRIVQAVQIGTVVLVIGTTLAVIGFLNQPYQPGFGGLEPVAMERTERILREARVVVGDDTPPPCDERGLPRT